MAASTLTVRLPDIDARVFQFAFAAITPLLFLGSVLGRIRRWPGASWSGCGRLRALLDAFLLWGGGYFAQEGALDFCGGYVIHMSAGVSGFVRPGPGPRLLTRQEARLAQ